MLIFYRFEPDDAYKKNAYKKKKNVYLAIFRCPRMTTSVNFSYSINTNQIFLICTVPGTGLIGLQLLVCHTLMVITAHFGLFTVNYLKKRFY